MSQRARLQNPQSNKVRGKKVGQDSRELFESTVLAYLDSAYNLARWLTRNEHDAEDIVQEAVLRAFRSFDSFTPGRDARAWLLAIVRNCCRAALKKSQMLQRTTQVSDDLAAAADSWSDPAAELVRRANSQLVHQALQELPFDYREILVLRELEEFSYKEIADVLDIPVGTVMSRLSRARRDLYAALVAGNGEARS